MAETPQDLTDILQAPSQVPPALPMPPGIQSFLPKPSLAEKIAPLAVLAASLAIGKNRGGGGLAAGYAGAQNRQEQQDFQHATALEADAQRNQQIAYQNQVRQQQIQQQDEQRRMQALNLVKQRVATIKDPKQYDQEIDSYASMFQQAGFRGMTSNQLRVAAPFVAPSGKSIAADAVNAWLKNPANAALMKKDPTIVGKVTLRIDTNGDGVAENVPLLRAGEIGGVQFATDQNGQFVGAVESKQKIGSQFQELLQAKRARFLADNKREPTPQEQEKLIQDTLKEGKAAAQEPDEGIALTPAGLDAAALAYAKTGQLPPMGMSKQSAGVRSRIINRAAEQYGQQNGQGQPLDVAANKATFNTNEAALKNLQTRTQGTEAAARTASDNLDLALAQSGQVARTNSKLANRYLQWMQGALSPAEGLTQFETYVYTAAREYAKVTSGGATSAQGLTDSAAKEAQKLLNTAQSPRAFAAAVKAMKDDMANVQKNNRAQVGSLQQSMRGAPNQAQPSGADAGWVDVGGGILVRKKAGS